MQASPRLRVPEKSMIGRMAKKKRFDLNVQIRSTPKLKAALDHVVASLGGSERLRAIVGRPTQEQIVNASWLWMESLPAGELEEVMARWLVELEAQLDDRESSPPSINAQSEVEPPVSRPRRRSG